MADMDIRTIVLIAVVIIFIVIILLMALRIMFKVRKGSSAKKSRKTKVLKAVTPDTDSEMDSIFNSPQNITNNGVGKFIQDDYAELGLGAESSRNNFVIYDKIRFDKLDTIGRFNYLSSLEPVYINPYTGTIISTD